MTPQGEKAVNSYVQSSRNAWGELVRVAADISPKTLEKSAKAIARAAGVGWRSVKEKLESIQWALREGRSEEYIVGRGQKALIADYRRARAEKRTDPFVLMGWKVTAETAFAIKTEVYRHCKILGIRDAETYFTFLHAEMSMWTPQQLRHSAGIPKLKRDKEVPDEAQTEAKAARAAR